MNSHAKHVSDLPRTKPYRQGPWSVLEQIARCFKSKCSHMDAVCRKPQEDWACSGTFQFQFYSPGICQMMPVMRCPKKRRSPEAAWGISHRAVSSYFWHCAMLKASPGNPSSGIVMANESHRERGIVRDIVQYYVRKKLRKLNDVSGKW